MNLFYKKDNSYIQKTGRKFPMVIIKKLYFDIMGEKGEEDAAKILYANQRLKLMVPCRK